MAIAKRNEQEAGRAPEKVDLENYAPFDPVTGKPRVWHRRRDDGSFDFYDRPGFDAQSGEMLLVISRQVIDDWSEYKKQRAAQRCYIITRDAITYGEKPGVDPMTGRECRLLTTQLLERLREYESGKRPNRIEANEPTFFDPRSGEAIVWYYKDGRNRIELFDLMGFHPETGDELLPITRQVVSQWRTEVEERNEQEARQAPEKVDLETYAPFDPLTGKQRVWYRKREDGSFDFYDRPGFDAQTGEVLLVISRQVIDDWHEYKKQRTAQRCYIITRDAITYGEKPGVDPMTGRECRLLTTQLLERLREYESGKRPNRIEANEPTFFDPRSGESIVWYYKDGRNRIELFDLMGFHPQTGEELLPISKEVAEEWRNRNTKQPIAPTPEIIDPANYSFFDPVTGEPRTWYWQNEKGTYEFYNNPGFHPRTGDELKQFTKGELVKYLQDIEAAQKRAQQEIERKKAEAARQAEADRREAERQKQERDKRREQQEKEAQAAKDCNQLAGNPNDPRRAAEGVPFDALKAHVDEAVQACERAVAQNPNEPRFQYQLARALAANDRNRKRAVPILQKLVAMRYPAAFDNLGWLEITERKNFAEAVKLFRKGTELGDPDAMVSLAQMIDSRRATPANPSESKLALYARAAQLGHPGAAQALREEQEKEAAQERQRGFEIEQQRQAREIFQRFLQRMPR